MALRFYNSKRSSYPSNELLTNLKEAQRIKNGENEKNPKETEKKQF